MKKSGLMMKLLKATGSLWRSAKRPHRMAGGLLAAFFFATASLPVNSSQPANDVTGRIIDLPISYPDGTLRFHVLPAGMQLDAPPAAPVPTTPATATFSDDFASGRKPQWQDAVGQTRTEGGKLVASDPQNVVILNGLLDHTAEITVEADGATQCGIIVRYLDPNNYVLAFYAPGQKLIGVHERIGGNFGAHVGSAAVGSPAPGNVTLKVKLDGPQLKLEMKDSAGKSFTCGAQLKNLLQPGNIGLYYDNTGTPAPQAFARFTASAADAPHVEPVQLGKLGLTGVPVGYDKLPAMLVANAVSDSKQPWRDVLGQSTRQAGRLLCAGPQNVILADGLSDRGTSLIAAEVNEFRQFGIIVRYQDPDNYVMAFYSPVQKMLAFHERIKGDFGPHIGGRPIEGVASGPLRLEVRLESTRIYSRLIDSAGKVYAAAGSIGTLTKPGGVGLYFDTAAQAGQQQFSSFELHGPVSLIPPGAVQVIEPNGQRYEKEPWTINQQVKVEGTKARAIAYGAEPQAIQATGIHTMDKQGQTGTLFPLGAPAREWVRFPALGYEGDVAGVVYRLGDRVSNGVALGGVDTGCIDVESSGLWGYSTFFNSHVPRSGPYNEPIIGITVGDKSWVLCDPKGTKSYKASEMMVAGMHMPERTAPQPPLNLDPCSVPKQIHYFGHYPVADMEFETDAPVSAGLRSWHSFAPGNLKNSMLPAATFELHLRNTTQQPQAGSVALNFPGMTPGEAGGAAKHSPVKGNGYSGVLVSSPKASYILAALGDGDVRTGGGLKSDGPSWAKIGTSLPAAADASAAIALNYQLAAGEQRVVRLVLAWHSPMWNGSGDTDRPRPELGDYTHMYAKHYPTAQSAVEAVAASHADLFGAVRGWQQEIYGDASLPTFLQEGLVNTLYLITETGLWPQKKPPVADWVREEDGLWGMNESPRACPQIECIPCSFYGNIPLVYFFPELALSTLRGYKGFMDAEGAPPWIFGGAVSFNGAYRGYQTVMNPACYTDMVMRYWKTHGDTKFIQEFYPSVKKTTEFMIGLNRGPDGVISMPDRYVAAVPQQPGTMFEFETEWFEMLAWRGMTSHAGGVKLAQLRQASAMADAAGDADFKAKCETWISQGQHSMETKLWNGQYYINFWDEATGQKSDHIFAYQLDGEWMTQFHGLEGVFQPDRVLKVLQLIKEKNVPPTRYGAINLVRKDGTVCAPGEWPIGGFYKPYDFFTPELYMLGMTYMYEGQKDFGLELIRRCQRAVSIEQGMAWDSPNIIQGDTGEMLFGNDYYQVLMLWALPAAIQGQAMAGPMQEGGLVRRIIGAAASQQDSKPAN